MIFKISSLRKAGVLCDFHDNQEVERLGGTVDMGQGTYTFPDDLPLSTLKALFQKGFPIPQTRTNAGLLFFLSQTDFEKLPEKAQIGIIIRLMHSTKSDDLFVDFNDFAKYAHLDTRPYDGLYDKLLDGASDKEDVQKKIYGLNLSGTEKACLIYRYLQE
jgi:hypothetical protein